MLYVDSVFVDCLRMCDVILSSARSVPFPLLTTYCPPPLPPPADSMLNQGYTILAMVVAKVRAMTTTTSDRTRYENRFTNIISRLSLFVIPIGNQSLVIFFDHLTPNSPMHLHCRCSVVCCVQIGGRSDAISCIKELVDRGGADVNIASSFGFSPLMSCCAVGETKLVNLLLSYGADCKAEGAHPNGFLCHKERFKGHHTAPQWAEMYGQKSVVAALKRHEARLRNPQNV